MSATIVLKSLMGTLFEVMALAGLLLATYVSFIQSEIQQGLRSEVTPATRSGISLARVTTLSQVRVSPP